MATGSWPRLLLWSQLLGLGPAWGLVTNKVGVWRTRSRLAQSPVPALIPWLVRFIRAVIIGRVSCWQVTARDLLAGLIPRQQKNCSVNGERENPGELSRPS